MPKPAPCSKADIGNHTSTACEIKDVFSGTQVCASYQFVGPRLEDMRSLQDKDVTFTVTRRLMGVARSGNKLTATIGTDYSDHTYETEIDQVVVNYGTLPLDDLYFDLKPASSNLGEVDYDALIAGSPQTVRRNADGAFQLFRIGDAVSARNTHAAIYDALRLVKDI